MIVDPWGVVLAQAADGEGHILADLDLDAPARDPREPARARQPSPGRLPLAGRGARMSPPRPREPKARDKRRLILDAAVRVFARQGFHACRVSDIADEAGVAYGLVYHYFASKDEVLDTLFLERWNVMLDLIRKVDARAAAGAREAAGDRLLHRRQLSPRPGPDEGDHRRGDARGQLLRRTHIDTIREAYELIGGIVATAQAEGVFKRRSNARFAAMAFYGVIEQLLTGWIFDLLPQDESISSAPSGWSWRPSAAASSGWATRAGADGAGSSRRPPRQ